MQRSASGSPDTRADNRRAFSDAPRAVGATSDQKLVPAWLFVWFLKDKERAGGLVAVSCAHRNTLAALGAAARQNCSSALGLHAAAKTVGLRAAAAIRLKCALRHGSALLKKLFDEIWVPSTEQKTLSAAISEYISSHEYPQKTRSMSTFSQPVVQLEI